MCRLLRGLSASKTGAELKLAGCHTPLLWLSTAQVTTTKEFHVPLQITSHRAIPLHLRLSAEFGICASIFSGFKNLNFKNV